MAIADLELRQMTPDDVPRVERLTAAAFFALDEAVASRRPAGWPAPTPRAAARAERWVVRMRHLVEHDGPGCWVAESQGELVGAVAALLREGGWGLSTFAVAPGLQGGGIGKRLLDAAVSHGPWQRGIICSSWDPRALHRYRAAGFELHPARIYRGLVDRTAIPAVIGVRPGSVGDVALLEAIDRSARGFGRGADHLVMTAQFPLLVVESGDSLGYVYHFPNGSPYLLAATDETAARKALWAALSMTADGDVVEFSDVTEHQPWAREIAVRAGLESMSYGYVGVSGMAAPPNYLPSGHFL